MSEKKIPESQLKLKNLLEKRIDDLEVFLLQTYPDSARGLSSLAHQQVTLLKNDLEDSQLAVAALELLYELEGRIAGHHIAYEHKDRINVNRKNLKKYLQQVRQKSKDLPDGTPTKY